MTKNRTSPEYWKQRRIENKVKKSPPVTFVAVDGEGTEEGKEQIYSLLSSSLHNPISSRKGLHTEECLRYLLSLKQNKRTIVVSFFFSYDVNMILKDLKSEQLTNLYETEKCWFDGEEFDYRICRTKGKTFTITEYTKKLYYHDHREKLRSVTVWDVWGFFQGSFLRAVEDWKIPLTPEQEELLKKGKEDRGGFNWADIDRITRYNHLECDLLVTLMGRVQDTMRGQGLHLSRWDGAGAIAASMMKKFNLGKHVNRGFHPEVENALMRAYFGGRSQCVRFGHFYNVYHYDINSSYPSSYQDLPTLHGEWKTVDRYVSEEPFALYQLRWHLPRKEAITPFPYRDEYGCIRYPHAGSGIYHSVLVEAAMIRWKRYITIEKGWIFCPSGEEKPFEFIESFMEERLRRKREGDLSHITMKLGANSLYGKTAQGICYGEKLPPYQSYYWAGRITAWTHAKLLQAAIQHPKDILFFGTDAIFTTIRLDLPLGTTLGTWEDCGIINKFELYQPGLYRMNFDNEPSQSRTRGFHREEVNFDCLAKLWNVRRFNGTYKTKTIRFQGLEICQAQNKMEDWGKWVTLKKELHLRPGGWGFPEEPGKESYTDPVPKLDNFRFLFIDGDEGILSQPFTKKNLRLPDPNDELGMSRYLSEVEYLDNPHID